MSAFEKPQTYDVVRVRKQKRTVYLAVTISCQDVVTREDYQNLFNTKRFTETEIKERLNKMPFVNIFLKDFPVSELKNMVLAVRNKFHQYVGKGQRPKWRLWTEETQRFLNAMKNN